MIRFLLIGLLIASQSVWALDVRTYIPKNAYIYIDDLVSTQIKYWDTHPRPELLGGLAETESCISLTHSRCWSPTSKLSSHRELGIGIPQITKAYNEDGSIRFDSLRDMRNKHMAELKEASWDNIATRPDLQFRILVLMNRDNYSSLSMVSSDYDRAAMTDAAYNGGLRGVYNDRRACGLKAGCNPNIWFDNVEDTCTKSRKPLYGGKSACDINRYHVNRVMRVSSNKYHQFWNKDRE